MKRSLLILIGLLVIIAAIVLLLLPSGEREASYTTAHVAVTIDSASTIKIEMRRPTRSIVIDNVGGRWTLTAPGHYVADASVVNRLLGDLSRMTIGSLISSNPEKQHLFQVDSTGTFVTVSDRSGKTVSFILGKMGPSFSEVYFRMPDSKEVYLAQGIDSWSVNRDVREWRDKTILTVPNEVVKELTYSIGGKHYLFARDSSGWKSGDKTIASTEISPTLSTLASLRADDFLDDGVMEKTAPITIGIKWLENTTLMLYPRMPDSTKYVVQSSLSSQLFVISKWTAQQLLKPVQPAGSAFQAPPIASTGEVRPPPVRKEQPKTAEASESPKPAPSKPVPSKPAPVKTAPPVERKEPVTKSAAEQKPVEQRKPAAPVQTPKQEPPPKEKVTENPPVQAETSKTKPLSAPTVTTGADEGDLQVHTVMRGETMPTIAKKYNVTVEQILKWNLLKSIIVKPGQELYIYVKK